jgi:hypothetical protein
MFSLGKQRTQFTSRHVFNVNSADAAFSQRNGREQVLVAVPRNFLSCMPILWMSVPTGPYVLWHSWDKNMGLLSPGLKVGGGF